MREDWDEEMSVGVEFLDVHHRQVWRRVRHLANAVSDGRADDVRAALRFLEGHLAEHGAEEERRMEDAGYPGAREHSRAHAAIRARIAAARAGPEGSAGRRLLEAAEWVARALREHLAADDLRLARFLTARENLRRLAEDCPGAGLSLTPVPGALRTVGPGPREDAPRAAPGDDGGPARRPRRR